MAVIRPHALMAGAANEDLVPNDHFKIEDGVRFAGIHLLLDMWGAAHLDDPDVLGQAMTVAVKAAEATLLHLHLHHFSPQGGVSGVAVLAESHISVHTWPEHDFAAFDIFMCGGAEPARAAAALQNALRPARVELTEQRRGVLPTVARMEQPL
ncbi:MAG: adenosylmethionine decarboxylase [Alphaproteobacteria bacterium]|nr:adenosylmethionine decarboxylase [Alphaproteobacteria bacterium]